MHVSKNRLEGSLSDTPLEKLLEPCRRTLFTGTIEIKTPTEKGLITVRAGAVDAVRFQDLTDDAALQRIQALEDGDYVIAQRVPDMSGALGSSAGLEGEVHDVPLAKVMNHCEQHALNCTLIIVNEFDRGEIRYRGGDLAEVLLNGKTDDDAIVTIVGWKDAKFRIVLPPLDLNISGWPSVGPEPTAPFKITQMPVPKRIASEGAATVRVRGPSVLPGATKKPAALVVEDEPEAKQEAKESDKKDDTLAEKRPEKRPEKRVSQRLATVPPGPQVGGSESRASSVILVLAIIVLAAAAAWYLDYRGL